jgi:sporulation protein YabP
MPIDDKNPGWRHQIVLTDREDMIIDGVSNLGSFDEKEVVVETEQGLLVVKGEGLNIKQLNLDKGCVSLEGTIKSVSYDDEVKVKKGLLERLLK